MNGTIDFAQPQINADERRFWERVFASSPRDAGVGRGPRRGASLHKPLLSPALSSIRWRRGGFFGCSRNGTAGKHRTSNFQLPTSNFQWSIASHSVRCSALDVRCSMFRRLGLELAVASSGKPINLAACPINRCKSWPSRAVCIEGRSRAPLFCMSPNA